MSRTRRRGLSLLEAALMVSIGGSLLAVAVPTFVRSLRSSKTNEAVVNLADLHARTATYFAAPHSDANSVSRRWCLPDEAGPTPRYPSANAVDFSFTGPETPGNVTWSQIGFSPLRTRFRYSLVPESVGCGIRRPEHQSVVTFLAEGDLDVDGLLSSYERAASISSDGTLVPEGALRVDKPVE